MRERRCVQVRDFVGRKIRITNVEDLEHSPGQAASRATQNLAIRTAPTHFREDEYEICLPETVGKSPALVGTYTERGMSFLLTEHSFRVMIFCFQTFVIKDLL